MATSSEQRLRVVSNEDTPSKSPRKRRSFPAHSLEDALTIATAIENDNAGRPFSRLSLAESIKRKPDSSTYRTLLSASFTYGLTTGTQKSSHIELTSLGRAIVSPVSDEERSKSLLQAALNVDLYARLYTHFATKRVPSETLFRNTLIREFAVEPEVADEAISHFMADGKLVGLLRNVSGDLRVLPIDEVSMANVLSRPNAENDELEANDGIDSDDQEIPPTHLARSSNEAPTAPSIDKTNSRVFISHGKDSAIVEQIKQILVFGQYEPIVAVEHETTAVPVPDKVMDAMRSCSFGVIHVQGERTLMDVDGQEFHTLNENVLIEIGAAMALYQRNFVLLVKQGTKLPSNLQGLYRCDYDGNELGHQATMKLLRTFSTFRTEPNRG